MGKHTIMIDDELSEKAKIYAIQNKIDFRSLVEKAIRAYLEEPKSVQVLQTKPERTLKEELAELGASSWAGMKHPSDEVDEAIEKYWAIKRSKEEQEIMDDLFPRQTKK